MYNHKVKTGMSDGFYIVTLFYSGGKINGYSVQRTVVHEPRVFSHELSTLEDVLILSPYGVSRVKKKQPFVGELEQSISCPRCAKDIEAQSNRIIIMIKLIITAETMSCTPVFCCQRMLLPISTISSISAI